MTTRDFAYWLQGFFEVSNTAAMTEEQVKVVKNHLNLVFKHDIDPSFGLTKEEEKIAQNIHDGINPWGLRPDELVRC